MEEERKRWSRKTNETRKRKKKKYWNEPKFLFMFLLKVYDVVTLSEIIKLTWVALENNSMSFYAFSRPLTVYDLDNIRDDCKTVKRSVENCFLSCFGSSSSCFFCVWLVDVSFCLLMDCVGIATTWNNKNVTFHFRLKISIKSNWM